MLIADQSSVCSEKNLQGHHEDQWVQQLQQRHPHPKTRGECQKPHLIQSLAIKVSR